MGTPSAALYSTKYPLGFHFSSKISATHFTRKAGVPSSTVKFSTYSSLPLNSANITRGYLLQPIKCAIAENPSSNFQSQVLFRNLRNLSFDLVKEVFSKLNSITVCKWVGIAAKWAVDLLLNSFFWMYFSWTWLFGLWFMAIGLGVYDIYCFRKYYRGEASMIEQLAIVTSAFTWLTLGRSAYFNGFLEG